MKDSNSSSPCIQIKKTSSMNLYIYIYKYSTASEQPGFLLFSVQTETIFKILRKIEKIKTRHSGEPIFNFIIYMNYIYEILYIYMNIYLYLINIYIFI